MVARDANETATGPRAGRISQDDVEVGLYQILDEDGAYDPEAIPDLDDGQLRDLYRWMLLERTLDERMVKLQRRGELGTYGSGRGQEASIIGSGYALGPDDWLLGMGREAGAMLLNGLSIRDLVLFWRGIEDASRFMAEENMMIAISIGSHLPLVTGAAWGMLLDGASAEATSDADADADDADDADADAGPGDAVVAAYFGDGASSTGAVHEAMNFAGVLGAPAVFFCQNNGYAISTPFEKQTRARTLAQRAVGYGLEGIRVDGNDVLAVYDAVRDARELARAGSPVLVESVTYRLDAHTTSDDPGRYRDDAEVDRWRDRDPIARYEAFLRAEGLWDEIEPESVVAEVEAEFEAGVEAANEYPHRDVDAVFDYLYDELPPYLQRQLAEFEAFLEDRPDAYDYVEQRGKE